MHDCPMIKGRNTTKSGNTLYKEKMAAVMEVVNHEQVSQACASSLLGLQRSPFSNITKTLDNDICTAATSASTDNQTEDTNVGCKKQRVPTVQKMKVGTTILNSISRPSFMFSAPHLRREPENVLWLRTRRTRQLIFMGMKIPCV